MKIHRLGGKNVTGFAVIFVANLTQILSQGHGILGNQGKQDWAEREAYVQLSFQPILQEL